MRSGIQSVPQVSRIRAPAPFAKKPGKRGLHFRELAKLALQEKQNRGIKESSLRADHVRLAVLDPLVGNLKIARLKSRTFSHALSDIAARRRLTPASFNRYHALVSSVCAYGVREELFDVNP